MKNYVRTIEGNDDEIGREIFIQLERDKKDANGKIIVAGRGSNITLETAMEIIDNNKWRPLKSAYAQAKVLSEREDNSQEIARMLDTNLGITFGKETLLRILSQQDCEAIRFYFCTLPGGKESLVGVGVDKQGRDLDSEDGILPSKPRALRRLDVEIGGGNIKSVFAQPIICEVGPPVTLRDVLELEEKGDKDTEENAKFNFEKGLRNYFL